MSVPEDNWVSQQWEEWRHQGWKHLDGFQQRWAHRIAGVLTILRDTWTAFTEDDGGTHAAAIGYYAIFSFFPLVVLLSLGLTFFLGDELARIQVLLIVSRYLPVSLQLVDSIVQNVLANKGTLSALALIGLLWGSIHIFRVLERSINLAWGAPRRRDFWNHLRFSVIMITITGILTSLSILATGLFRLARELNLPFVNWTPLQNPLIWTIISAVPPFALSAALLMLLYRFVPHDVYVRWRNVVPSALFAALLWEGAKQAFALYMANFAQANYNLLYGSLGAVIGLLTWVYVTGYVILLGAEMCAVLSRYRDENPVQPSPSRE